MLRRSAALFSERSARRREAGGSSASSASSIRQPSSLIAGSLLDGVGTARRESLIQGQAIVPAAAGAPAIPLAESQLHPPVLHMRVISCTGPPVAGLCPASVAMADSTCGFSKRQQTVRRWIAPGGSRKDAANCAGGCRDVSSPGQSRTSSQRPDGRQALSYTPSSNQCGPRQDTPKARYRLLGIASHNGEWYGDTDHSLQASSSRNRAPGWGGGAGDWRRGPGIVVTPPRRAKVRRCCRQARAACHLTSRSRSRAPCNPSVSQAIF